MLPKHPIKIWVVTHSEIWQTKPLIHWDDMIFHVASSLEKAEAFIKPMSIMGDAWWTIQEFTLDNPDSDADCDGEPRHYGNKGKLIKNFHARYKNAIKTFEKEYPKGDKT